MKGVQTKEEIEAKLGKPGQQTFELFDMLYSWPETLVTGSPSGGRHHWYRGRHLFAIGTDKSNHPGIDFAQYVILPGCMKAIVSALSAVGEIMSDSVRDHLVAASNWCWQRRLEDRSAGPRRHAGQGANRSRAS